MAQVALFLGLVWALFARKGLGAKLRLPSTAGGGLAGAICQRAGCDCSFCCLQILQCISERFSFLPPACDSMVALATRIFNTSGLRS